MTVLGGGKKNSIFEKFRLFFTWVKSERPAYESLESVYSSAAALAVFAAILWGFKHLPRVIRLSLSLISPSLGSGCNTQRKKVGSLLSSCWQLRKTMPIHTLGSEALSGPVQSLFVGLCGGGYPLSAFPYCGKKKGCLYSSCSVCSPEHML